MTKTSDMDVDSPMTTRLYDGLTATIEQQNCADAQSVQYDNALQYAFFVQSFSHACIH